TGETGIMRDCLWNLDRKAKVRRHRLRPPFIGRAAVRAMKRRVDLDRVEDFGITFEMTSPGGDEVKILRRHAPSRGADPQRRRGHRAIVRRDVVLSCDIAPRIASRA